MKSDSTRVDLSSSRPSRRMSKINESCGAITIEDKETKNRRATVARQRRMGTIMEVCAKPWLASIVLSRHGLVRTGERQCAEQRVQRTPAAQSK